MVGTKVSFPGVERLGCGLHHPPRYSAEVKESVELYLGLWLYPYDML